MSDYTVDEIMCTTLAAQFKDGDEVCNGMASFIPVAAIMLAQRTHAPDARLACRRGRASTHDPTACRPRRSRHRSGAIRSCISSSTATSGTTHRTGKNLGLFCVGAAQLDMYGNANNSIIGDDYHRPKVRLPGTAGLGDMGSLGKRLFYWNPNHSARSIVEKVDFRSAAGYLGGGTERADLGLTGGPELVVTNLAVLDFEPESKRMRLVSVHPGTTVEQVQEATGFELLLPDGEVPETTAPTAEQVRMLREDIDPDGMCKREAGVKS